IAWRSCAMERRFNSGSAGPDVASCVVGRVAGAVAGARMATGEGAGFVAGGGVGGDGDEVGSTGGGVRTSGRMGPVLNAIGYGFAGSPRRFLKFLNRSLLMLNRY